MGTSIVTKEQWLKEALIINQLNNITLMIAIVGRDISIICFVHKIFNKYRHTLESSKMRYCRVSVGDRKKL
jgi:hypothetical protein